MLKHFKLQTAAILFTLVLLLMSFTAATYAWFTNSPDTNVVPMEMHAGTTGGSLLICDTRDGKYDVSCPLPVNADGELAPISTSDLTHFFVSAGQRDEKTVSVFTSGDAAAEQITLHGTVYLKASGDNVDVYFDPYALDFGNDVQALAAMRLGMKFTTTAGTQTRIFRMDDFRDVTGAKSQETVSNKYVGMVVSSVSEGSFEMTPDPSVKLTAYCAQGTKDEPTSGTTALCTIAKDEICEVKYWLYLEGCDSNCFNEVQKRDAALQLGFFGSTSQS